MKVIVDYLKQVEFRHDIDLPYYFVDRTGYICKAFENYYITIERLEKDSARLEIFNSKIQEIFCDRDLHRFIKQQDDLKNEFEENLSIFNKRLNNEVL